MDAFYTKTDYVPLPEVGLDINFNKHFSHGLELRMLDAMPLVDLADICRVLVALADYSLAVGTVENPVKNRVWQELACKCLLDGRDAVLTPEEQVTLAGVFGVVTDSSGSVAAFYKALTGALAKKYAGGICAGCFLRGEAPRDGPFGLLPCAAPAAPAATLAASVMPAAAVPAASAMPAALVDTVAIVPVVSPPKKSFWSCMCYCQVKSQNK
jgi:hypothetical protein